MSNRHFYLLNCDQKNIVKELRESKNMSQEELAQELSISLNKIIGIESYRYFMNLNEALIIANFFYEDYLEQAK